MGKPLKSDKTLFEVYKRNPLKGKNAIVDADYLCEVNTIMNPNDKQLFTSRGVKVNKDLFAVSDLIQFLFIGCIRNGQQMN